MLLESRSVQLVVGQDVVMLQNVTEQLLGHDQFKIMQQLQNLMSLSSLLIYQGRPTR